MKKTSAPLAAVLLAAVTLAAATLLAGCGGGSAAAKPAALRMVGNENMAFLAMVDGKPTGFSADLAAEIASRIGRRLEVTLAPFPELFTRLNDGECDIAMSAITITEERRAEVAFSAPYFDSGQALLVLRSSGIRNEQDLRGKTVGALKDSSNQQEAESIAGVKIVLPFDAKEPMFDALEAGAIDAVVCDTPFARYNVKQSGTTRIAAILTTGDQYGIALRKGEEALLAEIDKALRSIRQDGTYDRLYQEYFGK